MVGDNTGAAATSTVNEVDNVRYTRAGNFYMDAEGYIVDGEGKYLAGEKSRTGTAPNIQVVTERIQVPTDAQSMSIGQDGTVSYVDSTGDLQTAGKLVLAKFPNTGGLEKLVLTITNHHLTLVTHYLVQRLNQVSAQFNLDS